MRGVEKFARGPRLDEPTKTKAKKSPGEKVFYAACTPRAEDSVLPRKQLAFEGENIYLQKFRNFIRTSCYRVPYSFHSSLTPNLCVRPISLWSTLIPWRASTRRRSWRRYWMLLVVRSFCSSCRPRRRRIHWCRTRPRSSTA